MLPRLRPKVHPLNSLPSTGSQVAIIKDKAAGYAYLPSPAASPDGLKTKSSQWFYNYPRLSFVLLFILCTFIGGVYVSSNVTTWTLDVLGIHDELMTAREVYVTTSHMLNTMTQCVERSSLEYLAGAKLQFEADSKRVQTIINANEQILADQRNMTVTCSDAFLTTFKEHIKASASDEENSTLNCFSTSFYENEPKTETLSSSRALVLAVRALLTTQVVSEAKNSVSEQATKFENQLAEMWDAVDTVKTTVEQTLGATSSLVSQQLHSLAPILSESDNSGHKQQSASRLGRLSKAILSGLSSPLTSTSTTSLVAIRKTGQTLHKVLETLAGLHEGFTGVLDTVDETWELLEKQLNATVQQATQLQKELVYAAESTAQQINTTSTAVMTSLDQAQQEVATSFDILHERWHTAVKELIAEGFAPWQRLGDQLVTELTANQRQNVRPENSIQRKYLLPDRTKDSSLKKEHEKRTSGVRDESWNSTMSSSAKQDKFDIDTAVLRASLDDVGTFITQVVFYVDIGRLTLMAVDLAVGLITESYSDMPMLDIRGITTVDTIGNVCEVFLCQHSISAVCYTLVTKAAELCRELITFLVLLVATSVITLGFFLWKKDHDAHCQRSDTTVNNYFQTTTQSITRALFENIGNHSERVVDPLDEIQKYAIIINDSIRNDYAALRIDTAGVWMNQSLAFDDSNEYMRTTSSFIRMFQDCAINANLTLAARASLSSQCLTNGLGNASLVVTPLSATDQFSANAPFLTPSTAFAACFPVNNLPRDEIVGNLQHSLACATEKAVYLSLASWWLLVVIFVANRFVVRMIIKAAGMYWWRFLSANRLQFVGFCQENGGIVASDKLQTAIQQHLREVKCQIICRFVGIGFAFMWVVTVIVILFHA